MHTSDALTAQAISFALVYYQRHMLAISCRLGIPAGHLFTEN
jgi:hypothetical protein